MKQTFSIANNYPCIVMQTTLPLNRMVSPVHANNGGGYPNTGAGHGTLFRLGRAGSHSPPLAPRLSAEF